MNDAAKKNREATCDTGRKLALDWDRTCREFYKAVVQNAGCLTDNQEKASFLLSLGATPPYGSVKLNDWEHTFYYGVLHRTLVMIAKGEIRECGDRELSILIGLFWSEVCQEHSPEYEKISDMWNRFEESLDSDDGVVVSTALSALSLLTPFVIPSFSPEYPIEAGETWRYTTRVFERLFERVAKNGFCWPEGGEIIKFLERETIELFISVVCYDLYKMSDAVFVHSPIKNLLAMLCCVTCTLPTLSLSAAGQAGRVYCAQAPAEDGDQVSLKKTLVDALLRFVHLPPKPYGGIQCWVEPEDYVVALKANEAISFLSSGEREEIILACIRDGYAPALFSGDVVDMDEFFKLVGNVFKEEEKMRGRVYGGLPDRGELAMLVLASQLEGEFFARMEEHIKDNAGGARVLKKHLSLVKNGVIDMFRAPAKKAEPEGVEPDSAYGGYLRVLFLFLERCRDGESVSTEVSF